MPRVTVGGDMAELVEGWGGGCVDWRGWTIWSLLERVVVVVCYGEGMVYNVPKKAGPSI